MCVGTSVCAFLRACACVSVRVCVYTGRLYLGAPWVKPFLSQAYSLCQVKET